MIQVFVQGKPIPQGSKNGFIRGGRVVLVEANKALPAWRKAISEKLEAENVGCEPMQGAIDLECIFLMPKAKSNKSEYPTIRNGDLDKLLRAVGDAATDAGVIEDDSQIIRIRAYKLWAEDLPGVVITIKPYSEHIGVSLN